jgi:hypothetical protein
VDGVEHGELVAGSGGIGGQGCAEGVERGVGERETVYLD